MPKLSDPNPFWVVEKHWYDKEKKQHITYERVIYTGDNKIYLKCKGLLTRRNARAIVNLLNANASTGTRTRKKPR